MASRTDSPEAPARATRTRAIRQQPSVETLSNREREVAAGLMRGLTNKQIGLALGISHRTVEIHRARLMRKLNASNLSQLLEIAFAQRDKLPDFDASSNAKPASMGTNPYGGAASKK